MPYEYGKFILGYLVNFDFPEYAHIAAARVSPRVSCWTKAYADENQGLLSVCPGGRWIADDVVLVAYVTVGAPCLFAPLP